MALPRVYNMFTCIGCKAALRDAQFTLCGINLNARKIDIFFDYKCGCGHHGRYLIPQDSKITASSALSKLADMLVGNSPDDEDDDRAYAGACEFDCT